MKTRRRVAVLMIALTALVLSGAVASAKSDARPLSGSFDGSGFSFDGRMSHLGRFTGEITSFTPTETGGDTVAVWTAANGDEVHITTVFTVTGSNPDTGLLTYEQDITIDGGTGRFSDATGSALATGETAGDFSTYDGVVSGTIGY